jgi:tRNA U38,U39,U40 pseudouridine synthase TruA
LAVSDVPSILEAKDRKAVQRVAPPHGLFLLQVTY